MMKLLKSTLENGFFKEVIRVLILNVFYIILGGSVGKFLGEGVIENKWFIINISLLVSLITYLLYSLVRFFTKPICLKTKIINTITDDKTYLVQGKHNENNEMILIIEVCKVDSLWKRIALWYIEKKGTVLVDISIEDNKKSVILNPIAPYSNEYDIHEYGFTYNISMAILNNLKHNNEIKYEMRFFANLNNDINEIATTDCTYTIIPRISMHNSSEFFISKLIKLKNTNDNPFKVVYKYN